MHDVSCWLHLGVFYRAGTHKTTKNTKGGQITRASAYRYMCIYVYIYMYIQTYMYIESWTSWGGTFFKWTARNTIKSSILAKNRPKKKGSSGYVFGPFLDPTLRNARFQQHFFLYNIDPKLKTKNQKDRV